MPAPPGYDYIAARQLRIGGVLAFTPGQYVPDSTVTAQGWATPGDVTAVSPNGPSVSPPSDGQTLAWSTVLGQYVPVYPSGTSELAYAENITGTAQAVATGTSVDVTGCVITVPVSTRPVWLSAAAFFLPTAAGKGLAQLQIVEAGSVVAIGAVPLELAAVPGTVELLGYRWHHGIRIGPTVTARTFKLTAACFADSGALAFNVANAYGGAPYRSWIAAEAR